MSVRLTVSDVKLSYGDFQALKGVSFDIEPGQFVTLLGPSGCGKTTLLRCIAGFLEPQSGEIRFDGCIMNDVPPHKRNTAMCFQSYALFPHKTIYENIRFGLRMHKVPVTEHDELIQKAMDMVGLTGLGNRKPYELSGGQQQRVALARCVVVRPNLLLFDEPLSNLDAKLREKVRVEIRELQRELGITAIYVTHDQAEALAISDTIIAMNQGCIEQIAAPRTIYDKSANRFVADFIGTANLLRSSFREKDICNVVVDTDIGSFTALDDNYTKLDDISVSWRPEDMIPVLEGQDIPRGCNVVSGIVRNSVYMGDRLDIFMNCQEHVFRASVARDYIIPEGSSIRFAVPFAKTRIVQG